MADKVKVAVRVRPMNRRELDLGTRVVVDMEPQQTILHHPSDPIGHPTERGKGESPHRKDPKTFAFDHCFWSMDESVKDKFDGQEKVFDKLGNGVLQKAIEGYNACIFAYGQTGSGKSYTMMGSLADKGLIPRLCDAMFEHISKSEGPDLSCKVEVSYMEIYNEKVHDLLDPKGSKQNLKVREHNILGPYVDGLSNLVVACYDEIENLMSEGNKSRTVAATNMNSESSRSHAVFNIKLTQTLTDTQSGVSGEKVSKISLVDLAGSERAQKTGAVGDRLREGSNINKSLTTLGLVISHLADQAAGKNKNKFVPYRDSVLTWLLKDNLGGNSKTVMVATISPAADNYEETLSTLRYADRAKRIVNHAVVNEDPNARIIRELREEVETLRHQLQEAESLKAPDLKDRLEESEKLMKEMSKTWEEKLQETERIHSERHAALEKMGISVQTSGIKVEQGTYFLVNLNADPCLNELLVYYLKESHTRIGRPDAPVEQDIQLSGLGILSEHCVVDIENADVFVTPMEDARTCVNGSVINTKTRVKHGDRILWGNNHFFRINCPRKGSPMTAEPEQKVDYDFAQQELMMQELSNDPIQEVISGIEKQHQEDKEEALAKQKQMYEEQMQTLRKQMMSPGTPSQSLVPNWDLPRLSPISVGHSQVHPKFQQWAQDRDKLFKQGFAKLREEVVKANALIREANTLAIEMGKEVEFSVTLQIPACNLSPNRKSGTFASEPAILVKRKGGTNLVWSMSKFENKIIDMRDMYEDRIENGHPLKDEGSPSKRDKRDPFYESSDNSDLIGVANVFLCCLFSDIKLEYAVPIINQQGEVSGKLHLEISKVNGTTNERSDTCSENSFDEDRGSVDTLDEENNGLSAGRKITVKVNIKQASGLPPLLSNFVFCQYSFWGQHQPTSVAPLVDMDTKRTSCGAAFVFDHEKEFTVRATEEFLEHCSEGALSIEVWGHRSSGYTIGEGGKPMSITHRSLVDRWSELQRKLELWVEIQELNEQGEYQAVEVVPHPEVPAAGVFQLRQGHSRRLKVSVNPVQRSGTLPLICEAITSMATGGVCARSKLQKGLDSYQDEDLNLLRSQWTEALSKRKEYLDEQLHRLNQKEDKSEEDTEREQSLMAQWMSLTEERNAVIDPQPGSGIPGAPADGAAPLNREHHIPVVFLDLNADDMSTKEELLAGANLILPKEHGATFYNLSIVKHGEKETSAVSLWDSSIHDSIHLNRVTPSNERVYIIVKIVVRLSHPAALDVCLRKRICLNVYKKQSITDRLKRRIIKTVSDVGHQMPEYMHNDTMQRLLHVQEYPTASGVIYEIVSNIPKASEQLEDRETLARLAASQNVAHTMDGETYIEKYIKGIAAVDNILALDKLRQEVTMKELVAATGRPIRKTSSVPNINNLFKMDAASPAKSLLMQVKAESIQDLSLSTSPSAFSPEYFRARANSIESKKQERQGSRPNFLNLRLNFSSPLLKRSESAPSSVDPYKLPTKLLPSPAVKSVTLKPLKEEHRLQTKPLLNNDSEDEEELAVPLEASPVKRGDADDFQDFETYHSSSSDSTSDATKRDIPHSSTADSLVDIPTKNFASSMTSSGYGSQGVSSQTLSSEDSTSIRSMNIEDNADPESGHEKHERQISHDSPAESGLNANSGGKGVSSDTDSSSTDAANIHLSSSTNTLVSQNVDQAGSLENVDGSLAQEEEEEEFDDNQLFQREPVKVYDDENLELSEQEEPKPNFQDQSEFDIFSEEAMEELERLGSRRMSQGSLDSMGSNNSDTRTPVRPSQLLEANLRDQVKRYSMELEQEVESFQDNHQEEEHLSDSEDAMSVCSFGSRADLNRLHHTPVPSWVKPGVPVNVTSSSGGPTKSGVVHFVGMTDFASGQWVGVELDQPEGKNDGSVKGVRYFKCRKRHGVFVRHDKLIMDKRRSSIKKSSTPNSKIVGNNTGSIERKTSAHAAANSSFMKPTSASKHKAK